MGLATFHRVLQSGIEDLAYARRIAQLRDYYFDHAPELAGYLLNPAERLPAPGLGIGLWQQFVTVAGMVAVITAVLAGSAGGLQKKDGAFDPMVYGERAQINLIRAAASPRPEHSPGEQIESSSPISGKAVMRRVRQAGPCLTAAGFLAGQLELGSYRFPQADYEEEQCHRSRSWPALP